MRCLHCGKRLTLLHQLKQRDFCSEEHARAYSEEQEQLALGRLIEAQYQSQHLHQKKAIQEDRARKAHRNQPAQDVPAPLAPFQVDPPGCRYGVLRNHCDLTPEQVRVAPELPKWEGRGGRRLVPQPASLEELQQKRRRPADAPACVAIAVEAGEAAIPAPRIPRTKAVIPRQMMKGAVDSAPAAAVQPAAGPPLAVHLKGVMPAPHQAAAVSHATGFDSGRQVMTDAADGAQLPPATSFVSHHGLDTQGLIQPAARLRPRPGNVTSRPVHTGAMSTLPALRRPVAAVRPAPSLLTGVRHLGKSPPAAGLLSPAPGALRPDGGMLPAGVAAPLPASAWYECGRPASLLSVRGMRPPDFTARPLNCPFPDTPRRLAGLSAGLDAVAAQLSKPRLASLITATQPALRKEHGIIETGRFLFSPAGSGIRRWKGAWLAASVPMVLQAVRLQALAAPKLTLAGRTQVLFPLPSDRNPRRIPPPAPLFPPPFLVPPRPFGIGRGATTLPRAGRLEWAPSALAGTSGSPRALALPDFLGSQAVAELLLFRQRPLSDWLLRSAPSLPVPFRLYSRDAETPPVRPPAESVEDACPALAAASAPGVRAKGLVAPMPIGNAARPRLFSLSIDRIAGHEGPRRTRDYGETEVVLPSTQLPRARNRVLRMGLELEMEAESWKNHFRMPLLRASAWWQSQPAMARFSFLGLVVVLAVMMAAGGLPRGAEAAGLLHGFTGFEHLRENIGRRAAVSFTDDFRAGLAEWEGEGDWAANWSYDAAGFVRTGPLAIYTPTTGLSNYHMEFLGQIEEGALSWVVRAADFNNYHVIKLAVMYPGALPKVAILRYPVIDGRPGKVVQRPLKLPVRSDTVYRVLTEVRGENYVLTVQGQVVDSWSEPRLPSGGVGLFSGPHEKARVRWVGVWHQYDTLGRLCAFLGTGQMSPGERSISQ